MLINYSPSNVMLTTIQIQKESLLHVINLDGCSVSVPNRNWASPMNAIEISHQEECLLETTKKICVFFAIGKELEEWHWAIKTASELIYRVGERITFFLGN